jgi:CRISPR-associated protein Cas5
MNNMNFDPNILLQSSDFSVRAMLTIDALAPLSMVTSMPGKYYRSQPEPSPQMIYGLMENALGWHVTDRTSEKQRAKFINRLAKKHKKQAQETGVGFASLLQFHVMIESIAVPPLMHYDDLWSQHLRGSKFTTGSRNYDYKAIPLLNAVKDEARNIKIEEKAASSRDPQMLTTFFDGARIHPDVLRPHFPQYYVNPKPREYVEPRGAYKCVVATSSQLAGMIAIALDNPAAPLYLGSNDGWVDVTWEVLP